MIQQASKDMSRMRRNGIGGAILAVALAPAFAVAEPIELKLAFFTSNHFQSYQAGVKPFVDAINAKGRGVLAVKVYANGALGAALAEQPQMVVDGRADIAFVIPGQTPYRFPDNLLIEMPSLFRNAREGTLVYTHLVAAKLLRGYDDLFVIGAYMTGPNFIHGRKAMPNLDSLKNLKVRANNSTEAEAAVRLGAIATVMPAPMVGDALAKGTVDATIMSATSFFDSGGSRAATNHYLLPIGSAPLLLVMSRRRFDSLPEAAKALVREHSGEWAARAWIESFEAGEQAILDKIKSDRTRKVVEPSTDDLEAASGIYRTISDGWAAKSPRNRELLKQVETELATIRSTK